MKKIILLSLLLLSQLSFGQDSLEIEYDKLTIKIDSLRTIKQNYEDKYSRYFELNELLKDVNNMLENHTTLPRGYSVQDLKTYKNKYLAELKVVNKPTDKETKSYEVSKKLLNIYLESSFDRYMRFKRKVEGIKKVEIRVDLDGEIGILVNPIRCAIYDLTGKEVLQTLIDNPSTDNIDIYPNPAYNIININDHKFKVSHLKAGVYMLRIESGGEDQFRKIVIK